MFYRTQPRRPGALAATLFVDLLEDRSVPAVLPLNLVSEGASGFVGEAFFRTYDADAAGTTRLNNFVQLKPTRTGVAEGYNTDARPLMYNESNGPRATRSLLADELPLVTLGGVQYRELMLDISQSRGLPALSMDELLVYVGDSPTVTGLVQPDGTLGGLTPVYDLDAGGDTHVVMNYTLNGSRTAGDVQVYIPAGLLPSGMYVTVYSRFGDNWGMDSGSLYWAAGTSPSETGPAAAIFSPTEDPSLTGSLSDSSVTLVGAEPPASGTDGPALVGEAPDPDVEWAPAGVTSPSGGPSDPLDPYALDPIPVG